MQRPYEQMYYCRIPGKALGVMTLRRTIPGRGDLFICEGYVPENPPRLHFLHFFAPLGEDVGNFVYVSLRGLRGLFGQRYDLDGRFEERAVNLDIADLGPCLPFAEALNFVESLEPHVGTNIEDYLSFLLAGQVGMLAIDLHSVCTHEERHCLNRLNYGFFVPTRPYLAESE